MPNVLITGANRGIGLELASQYAARGDSVIAACRQASDALRATGARVEKGVDVTDAAALAALASRLGSLRIDLLWLNAGQLSREQGDVLDEDAFAAMRRQFEVNTLGPLRTAQALRANLGEGSKIAIISSRMGSIADNESGGYYGYRASKAAANAIGRSLAIDLKPRGIGVFLLHPGWVATDMGGPRATMPPAESAASLIARLDALDFAHTGSFWHASGEALPW
ncbi:MAG TPA: SDR family oxidoreductase [Arenimonas sp.]|nr:SDR family oxidoreductase [Arenimonas sp.]